MTKETEIQLTVFTGGRYLSIGKSSEVKQSLHISSEAVNHFESAESNCHKIKPGDWKRLSKKARLEYHLQDLADFLSGHSGTKFSYSKID